jgi:dihydropteroate synthase
MANLNDLNQNKSMLVKGNLIDLNQPKIMGILNTTPDSFFEGSRSQNISEIVERASGMIENGADIIDIGGISTRPGALKINFMEEIKRIELPIKTLREEFPNILISLDTFYSQTAQFGLDHGVDIINDVSGGQIDENLIYVAASNKVPYILTHSYGMADDILNSYTDGNIIQQLIHFFSEKINSLHSKGIHDIIIDPGFGFGKTLEQNFEIIDNFELLRILGKPILVGLSRKSMIYKKLQTSPDKSLTGTIALNSLLLHKGATIIRVHDVQEMNQTRLLLYSN